MHNQNQFLDDFMHHHLWGDYCHLIRWSYYPDYPIRLYERPDSYYLKDIAAELYYSGASPHDPSHWPMYRYFEDMRSGKTPDFNLLLQEEC